MVVRLTSSGEICEIRAKKTVISACEAHWLTSSECSVSGDEIRDFITLT